MLSSFLKTKAKKKKAKKEKNLEKALKDLLLGLFKCCSCICF